MCFSNISRFKTWRYWQSVCVVNSTLDVDGVMTQGDMSVCVGVIHRATVVIDVCPSTTSNLSKGNNHVKVYYENNIYNGLGYLIILPTVVQHLLSICKCRDGMYVLHSLST